MALWLVRTGRHGEFAQRFLDDNRIYLTWSGLKHDLGKLTENRELRDLLQKLYPDWPKGKLRTHTAQISAFAHIGAMQNVQADQGLLVSWGGFKSSVDKEVPAQFFRVRLWDQDAIVDELLANYDKLDEDLRAELPLKRIWTIAAQEESD